MAGEIAKFFASLGFKADYKELDKFEKRLKSLRGADVRAQAQAGKESVKQQRRTNKQKLDLHGELLKRYRKKEATSLKQLALDRKRLSRQSAAGAFTAQERLELYKRMGQAEATLKQKELDRIQSRGQMEARAYQENARRERLAREARRAEDARRRREIQARGRLEAQAYEEDERRNRRRRRRIKRQAGMGLGAAAAMGFGGAMSVRSYQQSLGMERGLTAATGSQELGQQEMDRLVGLAGKYGINVADAGQSYASMLASSRGTKLEGGGATDAFEAVMAQSRVMNLSTADTQGVFRAVNQIVNKGSVMAISLVM